MSKAQIVLTIAWINKKDGISVPDVTNRGIAE